MSKSRPTLAIIPFALRAPAELDQFVNRLMSLWSTAPDAEVLCIDDGSPDHALVDILEAAVGELGFALMRMGGEEGTAAAANVGLRHALATERDALVLAPELHFNESGWLEQMRARTDTEGRPAAVVGARLLYPNGLLCHAGMFFSLLGREFRYRHRMGPGDLHEALKPCRCPVSGALQLIRHETLQAVGVYDEAFRLGWEDVDFCLRTFAAGLECIYEPTACAVYHGPAHDRSDPAAHAARAESARPLLTKYLRDDFACYVPDLKG